MDYEALQPHQLPDCVRVRAAKSCPLKTPSLGWAHPAAFAGALPLSFVGLANSNSPPPTP